MDIRGLRGKVAALGVGLLGSAVAFADATLPAAATTALSDVSDQAGLMLAAGWPILGAIVGGLVVMKVFKKVVSRAT